MKIQTTIPIVLDIRDHVHSSLSIEIVSYEKQSNGFLSIVTKESNLIQTYVIDKVIMIRPGPARFINSESTIDEIYELLLNKIQSELKNDKTIYGLLPENWSVVI